MNNHKITKLKNGLQIIKVKIPNYRTCSIIALIRVGSKHEDESCNGAAHFLEHSNFKGTTKIPNSHTLTKELDSIGCSFNAYTIKHLTVYHFKTAYNIKYIDKILFTLSQILFESLHKASDIESERGIILEELKKTMDNPDESIEDYVAELMFKNNSLGLHTLGTMESIKKISQKTIKSFYKKYYTPNNTVISIAGKIPLDIDSMISKYFNKYPKSIEINHKIVPYIFEEKSPQLKVVTKTKSNQCYINIAFPAISIYDPKYYAVKLLSLYLGGNMSSYLFKELRDKHSLVYDISSELFAYEEGGYLSIYTSVDPKNVNKTISIILDKLSKLHTHKFDNLDILKINIIHSKELEGEDTYNIAEYYGEELMLFPKVKSTQENVNLYQKVTQKNLINLVNQIFNFDKMKVVIIGNIKSKDIKLSKILKVVN